MPTSGAVKRIQAYMVVSLQTNREALAGVLRRWTIKYKHHATLTHILGTIRVILNGIDTDLFSQGQPQRHCDNNIEFLLESIREYGIQRNCIPIDPSTGSPHVFKIRSTRSPHSFEAHCIRLEEYLLDLFLAKVNGLSYHAIFTLLVKVYGRLRTLVGGEIGRSWELHCEGVRGFMR